jgi:hypothetical protein
MEVGWAELSLYQGKYLDTIVDFIIFSKKGFETMGTDYSITN